MGLAGISPWSLLLILLIILLLFGTDRVRTIGKDLGLALKSFKDGIADSSNESDKTTSSDINTHKD